MNTPIRLVLADVHPIYLHGLASILDEEKKFALLGLAHNGEELLRLVDRHHPDVAILEVEMPLINGIEATRLIRQRSPATGVIVLTSQCADYTILDLIGAGATGYLLKTASPCELCSAVEAVHSGHTYYARPTARRLQDFFATTLNHPATPAPLSHREREITRLICLEYTSKQIAADLHLSIKTVEGYRKIILEKTRAQNLAGIVTYAIRTGLYKP